LIEVANMARPKIMNKMKRTIVQLDEKDYKKLRVILNKEGKSIAQMFREAVAVKLTQK
jgi:hypothetical protein